MLPLSIQRQESTWFSSNDRILLGAIDTLPFSGNTFDPLIFSVRILQYEKNNFAAEAPTKLLYTKSNVKMKYLLRLEKAITIQPHVMYEIRFENMTHFDSGEGNPYHCAAWEMSEVKLDGKISIKFHRNPFESDSPQRGVLTALYFNRIE